MVTHLNVTTNRPKSDPEHKSHKPNKILLKVNHMKYIYIYIYIIKFETNFNRFKRNQKRKII